MSPYLFLIVFFIYLLSFVLYFIDFELKKGELAARGKQFALMGLVIHFVFILAILRNRSVILIANPAEFITPFIILLISYVLENRYKARFFMLFSLPIALLLSLFAIVRSHGSAEMIPVLENRGWLVLHLGFVLTGLAGLLTAVSSAMMYLLQSTQLKSKHLGTIFFKLPSLDILDRIHFISLIWGIILFSLGILSGVFWAQNLQELGQIFRDPKVILSMVTCLAYFLILCLRFSAMRRGQKIAIGTVIVFILLFMTIVSSHDMSALLSKGA